MKMRGFLTALIALATTYALPAIAAEKWDLPMQWPAGNFYAQSAQKFADKVKEVTKGEVEIAIHYNGSLGFKGGEMLRAIRDGLVPIGDVTQRLQVGDEPFMGIEGLPYLAAGVDERDIVLQQSATVCPPIRRHVGRVQSFERRLHLAAIGQQRPSPGRVPRVVQIWHYHLAQRHDTVPDGFQQLISHWHRGRFERLFLSAA